MAREWGFDSPWLRLLCWRDPRLDDLFTELRAVRGSLQWVGVWSWPRWSRWACGEARSFAELFAYPPPELLPSEAAKWIERRRFVEGWIESLDCWRLHTTNEVCWTDERRFHWRAALRDRVVCMAKGLFLLWRVANFLAQIHGLMMRWWTLKRAVLPIDKTPRLR